MASPTSPPPFNLQFFPSLCYVLLVNRESTWGALMSLIRFAPLVLLAVVAANVSGGFVGIFRLLNWYWDHDAFLGVVQLILNCLLTKKGCRLYLLNYAGDKLSLY
eukprot:CCRYP_018161-RB/>CCRYP_018161-RB protein AED:0.48 eAED:1.00 QI:0/-1/0/1/-1/0/1/0/104